ncbi:MAG: hypothetical protein CL512_04155 [Actinobacteria bacterium]|nr:hypothetical protein [Actinomycetota bacterium]|tara:strand:- start:193 stop:705 length:513 start_codon:yes stop_codon:yes gene_type:complete
MEPTQEDLMILIQEKVLARRKEGDYPLGLEQQLDHHYQEILKGFKIKEESDGDLQESLRDLRDSIFFSPDLIETWSRNPLKRIVHRFIAKLTIRQTRGILDQFQKYAIAMEEIVIQLLENQETLSNLGSTSNGDSKVLLKSKQSDIDRRLSTALDRLTQIEESLNPEIKT